MNTAAYCMQCRKRPTKKTRHNGIVVFPHFLNAESLTLNRVWTEQKCFAILEWGMLSKFWKAILDPTRPTIYAEIRHPIGLVLPDGIRYSTWNASTNSAASLDAMLHGGFKLCKCSMYILEWKLPGRTLIWMVKSITDDPSILFIAQAFPIALDPRGNTKESSYFSRANIHSRAINRFSNY